MARQRAASREHAVFLADLARLWVERDDPKVRDDREEMDLVAAIALRTTTSFAGSQLRDAHLALTDLPRTYAQLAAGVMPVEWFTRLVVAVRALTQVQRDQVDQRVATWQLASIPAESFRRHLKTLIAWFTAEQKPTCPQELRDVTFEPSPAEDGTACVRLTGPIPELVSFTRRLDQSARAVQNQQRHALAEGAAVPFDLDGQAQADGRPLSLAALRYAILTRTELETGPVEVPAERFMINVVVPAMTLMGYCDAPALLDGITPVPAPMARKLAAGHTDWYRILTDPHTGKFLPLPAEKYRPTTAQLEYLRLVDPICAMPGCTRPTSCNCEGDHIDAFHHALPRLGGRTCILNMHMLCWTHHRLKTLGLLNATRIPATNPQPPGRITPTATAAGTRNTEPNSTPDAAVPISATEANIVNDSPDRASPPKPNSPPDRDGPPESNSPPERDRPPERDGPPDPLDHPGGMITHWVLKKSLQVQVEANRDLLTPDLAAILQDAWDQYLLDDQIHALIKNGEYDRLARDATDITDFHHYLTTTGELPNPDPEPPF